jgi:hypothetical protein
VGHNYNSYFQCLSVEHYWQLASARALPSLPGLARAVLWTVERLPSLTVIEFDTGGTGS